MEQSAVIGAIRDAIHAAKGTDPLGRVTVVVPTHLVGLQLRRDLVDRSVPEGPGLLNVDFKTLDHLAEFLAGATLARKGKKRIGQLAYLRAVQQAIRQTSLAGIADHPASVEKVARLQAELRKVDQATLEGPIRKVSLKLDELLKEYADERDLYEAAIRETSPSSLGAFGTILLLPAKPDQPEYQRRLREALNGIQIEGWLQVPTAQCWILPDAEQECRGAAAHVASLSAAGIPLHRIAVVFPNQDVYDTLITETFQAADIPHNARSSRKLAETEAGRFLSGFLQNIERGFRRSEVMDWLSSVELIHQDSHIPVYRWDRLTKKARIIKGLDHWTQRLDQFEASADARAIDADSCDSKRDQAVREAEACREIKSFLADIDSHAIQFTKLQTWADFQNWARAALEKWLPRKSRQAPAYELFLAEVDRLDELEDFCPSPSQSDFASAVNFILDKHLGARQPFGHGVFVGTLREAYGLEFQAVVLIGMSEANLPRPPQFGILSRAELVYSGLPDSETRLRVERAHFDSICSSCKSILFTCPRADLRSMKEAQPSLWFLEELAKLACREQIYYNELDQLGSVEGFRSVASFAEALKSRPPASRQEFSLMALLAGNRESQSESWKRGMAAQSARLHAHVTEWDGAVALAEQPRYSASSLEDFGTCPHRFFLKQMLKLRPEKEVDDIWNANAKDKGKAVHDALADFFKDEIGRPSEKAWTEEDHGRFQDLLDRELDRLVKDAYVRDSPAWRFACRTLKGKMRVYLEKDSEKRKTTGSPLHMEYGFGLEEPLALELEGIVLSLKGFIDRVDFNSNTNTATLIDYKTGSGSKYGKFTDANPLINGTLFQLPLYGEVTRHLAEQMRMPADIQVKAEYHLLEPKPKAKDCIPIDIDQVSTAFRSNLRTLNQLSQAGLFPAAPGGHDRDSFHNCRYCDFNRMCLAKRQEVWDRKSCDPRLADFVRMTTNTQGENDAEDA